MKRRDLIKKLQSVGFELERNGANHEERWLYEKSLSSDFYRDR